MKNNIKIHVLHCGAVGVDPAVPFRDVSKNPLAFTGLGRSKNLRIWLPVSAYLIEHPKGLVLIDTGWHRDVRVNQKKHMSLILNMASKAILPEGQAIDEQLFKLGIAIKELDYVFISHMDIDHVSGVQLVKDAKNILISEEEYNAVEKGNIRYGKRIWNGVDIKYFKMKESNYGPFNRSFDVFGDETVLLIDAKGHTEGNFITLIQNKGKFILLTADCGYAKESWDELRLPGPLVDKSNFMKSLKWIQTMSKDKNCIEVLATHDTNVKPHVIEL